MSCQRCLEVHNAQREGKTQESCKCSCHNDHHNYWYTGTTPSLTVPNWTGTINTTSDNVLYNCNCITSSEQCNNCRG